MLISVSFKVKSDVRKETQEFMKFFHAIKGVYVLEGQRYQPRK
jgi:hypothetical protein